MEEDKNIVTTAWKIPSEVPNKNNHIYPKHVIEKVVKTAIGKKVTSDFQKENSLNMKDWIGTVKDAYVEGDNLIISAQIFDDAVWEYIKNCIFILECYAKCHREGEITIIDEILSINNVVPVPSKEKFLESLKQRCPSPK